VREVLTVAGALSSRTTAGGTAPSEVANQLKNLTAKNADFIKLMSSQRAAFSGMMSA
jgi:argininosuccinate lyase